MRVEDWLESTDLTYGPCILLIEHADRRHFAGRFENLAAALPAISRLSYRSQLDERFPSSTQPYLREHRGIWPFPLFPCSPAGQPGAAAARPAGGYAPRTPQDTALVGLVQHGHPFKHDATTRISPDHLSHQRLYPHLALCSLLNPLVPKEGI